MPPSWWISTSASLAAGADRQQTIIWNVGRKLKLPGQMVLGLIVGLWNITTEQLRSGTLSPVACRGGWHFYADDENRACCDAPSVVAGFVEQVRLRTGMIEG
jgi:hypothetical protein